MNNDIDFNALFEGLQVDDDLLIKATLRVPARPMKSPVAESLSSDLKELYKARANALMEDIEAVLNEEEPIAKSILVFEHGRVLFKALGQPPKPKAAVEQEHHEMSAGANAAKQPSMGAKTVNPGGDRKLTPSGYIHVESPGSRGGKFWRDDKGNVRYGEKPHGDFQVPASPEYVVEHYRKYYAPQPFAAHNQMDMHEALMQSDVLSEADHGFMEFWHDNYDTILEAISGGKLKRKDVERAGGLQNMSFKLNGRDVGIGEMIEEFFRTNANLFVGDPTYGDIESPEDVLEAVRGVMDRYRKALNEDPKVQALAQASAEKREAERNAFYIECERSAEEFSPLAGDMVTKEDFEDLTVKVTAAMAQMGLIERGGKGGVSQRRMRGAIVPKSSMLLQDKRNLGSLWKDDQLERLSAAQLMALHVAVDAQESFAKDNTFDYEPGAPNEQRDRVFDLLSAKLGIEPDDKVAKDTLKRKLEKTTEATLRALTAHNTNQDVFMGHVLHMRIGKLYKDEKFLDDYKKQIAEQQANIQKILAAQEDTNFEPPPSMQNGVWNGKTLKDAEHPEKGVWAPFEYQKKYINWMLAAKRGVIAADAGMGKTPTVIAFRELLASQGKDIPAVCFLPPSLMEQWPAAIKKFAPDQVDNILNLSGLSLEERKVALQSDMAKKAKYIFISTGTLTGEIPDPNASEDENDGTGGSDQEMVKLLQGLNGAVFIDEAHQGGYKKAGNTRHEIAKAILKDREYAFGMTATPMPNDPMDVYHLANLFAPGSVGDEELWAGRTAGVAWNEEEGRYEVSNPEHLAELNQRLKPWVFYKSINDPDVVADMGKGLPKKTGVHEDPAMHEGEGDLELSRHSNSENGLSQHDYFKEGGVIDTMVELRIARLIRERKEKELAGEINPTTGAVYEPYHPNFLQLMAGGMKIMLQRQASISPALIDHTYRKQDGGVAHSPKIKALCDDIVAHFSNGGQGGEDAKPIVVFSSFPGKAFAVVRKALADRGVDPSLIETIAGDVAPTERGYMQDKLNKGHAKVLLVGTMSGGAGLNLQEAANKTLFLDEPWNPAAKRQAIGRVWRTGQNNTVHEKTYRSVGTYDAVVEQKIAGKQAMVAALLGKDMPTESTFKPDTSIKELLGRVKGTEFTEDQIKAIMENSKNYDLASSEHKQAEMLLQSMHDEDWKEKTAGQGFGGGYGGTLTDKDFEPNKKAQETLKNKGAHALTQTFDEKEFRAKWEMDRNQRRSKQNYEMANLMADVYSKKGDKEKAEMYKNRAAELAEKYPDLKGESAGDKGGAKKKGDKKPKGDKSKEKGEKKPSKSQKEGGDETPIEKPKRVTATVADAEQELKNKKKQSQSEAPKGEKPKQGDKKLSNKAAPRTGPNAAVDSIADQAGHKARGKSFDAESANTEAAHHAAAKAHDKAAEAHRAVKYSDNDAEAEKHEQTAAAHRAKAAALASKVKQPVVKTNEALGVDFHSKKNPFPENARKVKGTDVTNAEANYVLDLLHKEKNVKSWDDFITQHIKPVWDEEDGRNPFSLKAAHEYVGKIVDAIANQGLISMRDDANNHLSDDQKAMLKESGYKAPSGSKVESVKRDRASDRIVHNVRHADGSRSEVSTPGKPQQTKDVLADLDAKTKGAAPKAIEPEDHKELTEFARGADKHNATKRGRRAYMVAAVLKEHGVKNTEKMNMDELSEAAKKFLADKGKK